ncbi:hypothetical protein H257_19215 [Aphanomyces astaci]|uniref:Integrase catalytic domain-containing protein n=1 Tax=Aphanomyces astaci TaxID=112090 RepID=W4FAL7_APHAT|nr:hypothetical protein H257_19215 [Aphanomyces astaci]ETV63851.1 hypothetical protein H257_19215 [Aphanomyces astaci]|eukprot:XP_009846665.1 hypothetical protein H257_19215 [Aphanomyces astaci]
MVFTKDSLPQWFAVFGVCYEWVSDQGTHFKNQVMTDLQHVLGAHHHFTTDRCPWANGTAEVVMSQLLRLFRACLSEWRMATTQWNQIHMVVMLIMNRLRSPSLGGVAPVTAMSGRPAMSPLDTIILPGSLKSATLAEIESMQRANINRAREPMDAMHKEMNATNSLKRDRACKTHNKKRGMQMGQFVVGYYMFYQDVWQHHRAKLRTTWCGPAVVTAVAKPWNKGLQCGKSVMLSSSDLAALVRRRRSMSLRRRLLYMEQLFATIERPIIPDIRFDISSLNNTDAILKFRFDVCGIQKLTTLLKVPGVFITSSLDRCHAAEALCIVLFRLSYPRRYIDMVDLFGRSRESLCRIFNGMVDSLYDTWKQLIYFSRAVALSRLDDYKSAIISKGSPVTSIFAFIDGSKIQTCRITQSPGLEATPDLQRYIYSGHKRMHCLNFQALTAPDGLCIHFWGPIEGSRHDTTLLRESELLAYLDKHIADFGGSYIYGDPAYGCIPWIMSGFKGKQISQQQRAFNGAMSRVRLAVEWSFGRMKTLWPAITFKMQQKIMLQNVGKLVLQLGAT